MSLVGSSASSNGLIAWGIDGGAWREPFENSVFERNLAPFRI